ncbi:MAG: hypothetical protein RRA35_08145 [Desulfomonilia bacterium]|nr:hypothetical protein [Desulfomonilia bacterium]
MNDFLRERITIPVSERISFVHDPSIACGKTRDMAKGLFLCCRERVCAGESAGMGLPVLKHEGQTIFPSLTSMDFSEQTILIKHFAFDRTLAWQAMCRTLPLGFGRAMESAVETYKTLPFLQHLLLRLRDVIFSLFSVHSRMNRGSLRGHCSVVYEKMPDGLVVSVQGSLDPKSSRIILLNEVDGTSFNRLRIGETVLQDSQIPSWHAVQPGCRLESSSLGIGFSIAFVPDAGASEHSMFCGREVALDLDWAGFSLEATSLPITYQIHIHGTHQ